MKSTVANFVENDRCPTWQSARQRTSDCHRSHRLRWYMYLQISLFSHTLLKGNTKKGQYSGPPLQRTPLTPRKNGLCRGVVSDEGEETMHFDYLRHENSLVFAEGELLNRGVFVEGDHCICECSQPESLLQCISSLRRYWCGLVLLRIFRRRFSSGSCSSGHCLCLKNIQTVNESWLEFSSGNIWNSCLFTMGIHVQYNGYLAYRAVFSLFPKTRVHWILNPHQ